MPEPTDDELDYLLSRGRLGGSQREKVLRDVLAASGARSRASRGRRSVWGATGALAAAAAIALLLWPRAPDGDGEPSPFRAKGNAGGAPIIDVVCLGATLAACPRKSLVAFSVEGADDVAGFLSAHADPIDGGERIWYLTDEPVGAVGDAGGGVRTLSKAARIGDEHATGRYRVQVVFTRRPLSRAEPEASGGGDLIARAEMELRVLP